MAKRFGVTLRRLRQDRGLTQTALAEKVGVVLSYVCMLESGAKANPSLAVVKRLAKVLKVTVADLVE